MKITCILAPAYYEDQETPTLKTEPFFDLALIESVNPDGFRCYAAKGTEKVNVMASEYTEDGGHLNSWAEKKWLSSC